jgi:hypothetical protein
LISVKKIFGTKFRGLLNLETSEGRQTEEVCPNSGSKRKIHGMNLKEAHCSSKIAPKHLMAYVGKLTLSLGLP